MAGKMVLVDGNSLMHRAFHALPLLTGGDGVYTNAVYGFCSMLFKVLKEETPDMLAVAFDLHGPTFRHEAYEAYKAGRSPTPEELRPQFALLKELLAAMSVKIVSVPRYEADDMLGTLSKKCEEMGTQVLLITGDRDAFQLAGEHTSILYTKRGISDTERVTPAYLMEKYALTPDQMIDLKGLMGDASDNIPGIPGVGEKTALKLLQKYGSLEQTLKRGADEEKGKLREKLIEFADQARFSKYLATVERNAPIECDLPEFRIHDLAGGLPIMEKYGLKTLAQRLLALPDTLTGAQRSEVERVLPIGAGIAWQPVAPVLSPAELSAWARAQDASRAVAIAVTAERLQVATQGGQQAEIALGGGDLFAPGVTQADALGALKELLCGSGEKILCGLKSMLSQIAPILPAEPVYDAMLAAYAIDPQAPGYTLDALLEQAGIAQGQTRAAALFDLAHGQKEKMRLDQVEKLYEEIELPLAYALFDMEQAGFSVDEQVLKELGGAYTARLAQLTARIYELAGAPFNLNSPKQLGDVLFGTLGLPGGKKTARGYSTTADALDAIADQHEIVPLILDYRKYFKLNSTYVEALLRLRGSDGRIHTSFDQVATATGRISSNEPNLQNIPVRTPEGREIRRAFVARPGWTLVDADYSQIELRVLAHMSGDATLMDAFQSGQDVHRRTAAEVYGVPLEQVSGAMRSAAKAVNFGIVYGISEFGLANNIGVSRREASEFIARYFARYPGVKRYMDEMVALGKAQGYVTTMFGRRRYLKELQSDNHNTRAFGERVAMNSPIQGSAADIIKIAMIRTDKMLRAQGLKARLILQVHDELIVEAPIEERAQVEKLLLEAMEGAAKLSIPLKADLSTGGNWHECKS
ncbi:MAG: DNA polymerase I [Clostridia bacterium]